MEMNTNDTKIKVWFTIGALLLFIIRSIWPNSLPSDAVTISLLIAIILPWVSSFLKNAKLPGGWEFTFQELKDQVNDQQKKIEDQQKIINQVVAFAMSYHLFNLLKELHKRSQTGGEYLYRNNPDFKRDLYYLRDAGYLESNIAGKYLSVEELEDGQNLIGLVKLTPIGSFLVDIREKMEKISI